MFTGLVEEVGCVEKLEQLTDAVRLTVHGPMVASDAAPGDSIAVDGVCLTVVDKLPEGFTADVMQETLNRSRLGSYEVGSRVNLERALAAGARLGGHIVQGHVDGVGELLSRTPSEHWEVLRFSLPADLARYVVEKGSIAINGTSLTISAVGEDFLEVSLIPTTLADTTFGDMAVGEPVNLEVDVVAKYVEKMVGGYHLKP
ncbi:riboflavin synthase [Corynebacterium sp. MSK041]|uniref:riboflavin synthase n=1 Tax=Corynebacterium sp. MSK041 TaxID=3050194 RepID=UPI002549EB5F|nr:riboflavin synthase [Corynebacterium sp. MSK041]MDK8795356.1 riboflavin synthase [Corynebacterium sp. MSK041]